MCYFFFVVIFFNRDAGYEFIVAYTSLSEAIESYSKTHSTQKNGLDQQKTWRTMLDNAFAELVLEIDKNL